MTQPRPGNATGKDRSPKRSSFGPAGFAAVMLNLPIVAVPTLLLLLGGIAAFFLVVVLIDLVVAICLAFIPGTAGQIGKGMLIAWVALPLTAIVVGVGVVIANA